ncbi:MAG TPA: cysteine--tRNA ligase, partial [Candidatus Saccharimonadales bacterium]
GHTYIIDDGVYFDTTTFTSYADFAHLDLAALKAGARVSMNTQKRNPSDFALWKFSPTDEQRDMEWDSPWAPPGSAARKGFPGWHIECSAMAMKYLGDTLDIHTGGIDHIPVHHTNEIAQSEAATGKPFANIWTHANFLLVNGTKISKSLGNGFTLADLADKGFSAMDFKLFVLQSNYRTESNFTWDNLAAARNRLLRWRTVACLRHQVTTGDTEQSIEPSLRKVHHSLTDDLNSPVALTHIDELMDQILQQPDSFTTATLERLFERLDDALGLRLIETSQDVSAAVRALIDQRLHARESKDWQRSDSLRDELKSQGIGVNDTAAGSNWYYL